MALLTAYDLKACQACRDIGTIETRIECKPCRGLGTVKINESHNCVGCGGTGQASTGHSGYDHFKTGTYCRQCKGKGRVFLSSTVPCESCSGQGVIVGRSPCVSCGGKSGGTQEAKDPSSAPPSVAMVKVEPCSLCGPEGKVEKIIVCERCERGYCHKKATENGKDVFTCRKCGKASADRFLQCVCGTPDCPSCGGKYKRVEAESCKICGGDKIITPLEKARVQSK